MNTKFSIAKNTLAQFVGKAFSATTTIIITFLVVREYSGEFGNLVAILTFIGIFFVLPDFGINAIAVKDIVTNPEKEKAYYKNLLGLRFVLSIFVIFSALAILSFTGHPPDVKLGIIIALSIVILQALFISSTAIFQAKERYDLFTVADVLGSAVTVSLVFLIAGSHLGLIFVVLAYLVGAIVRTSVGLYLSSYKVNAFGFSFDTKLWSQLLWASWPIGLILIFSQINANLDKQIVFLAKYNPSLGLTGEVSAAIYGFAYRFFDMAIAIPTFIINSAYPLMVTKKNEGMEIFLPFVKKLTMAMFGFGVVVAIIGFLLAPYLVDILSSGKLPEATMTTRILFFALPIFFVTAIELWVLITLGKQKIAAGAFILVSLFNFTANIYFVPRFGYNAAAVTTIFSELLILVMLGVILFISLKTEKS